MADTLRIKDWGKHFENAQSRKLDKLSWVPIPNKHDGDGYSSLVLGHPNGPAHYAAWITIVQVAAKCDPRGTLLRDGDQPHTSASLSRKTRLPEELFIEAIPRLIDAEIGWLEVLTDTGVTTTLPLDYHSTATQVVTDYDRKGSEGNGREAKGREGKGKERKKETSCRPSDDVCAVIDHYRTYHPQAQKNPTDKSKESKAIKAMLKEGYTVDDLKAAIDGCHRSPWHQGENDKGTKYDSLELIMRNSSKVTQFMEVPENAPVLTEQTRRNMRAAHNFINDDSIRGSE